ncbi:PVC-type heme-binding CxxCH protein [Alienimonas californiensis]|uniref:NPCBM/NEW2 domain protein n=1 Tax=Alienimonas californiensis TaxID=2527989 RepID=A0A517PE51_9PLAN|nr:PVC-type heme-binding CxxCH protein [Alienimonas californiensis]QDT17648.1 NPCBM/NEW2 domain protein [Alienimonas californiensis]
MPEPRRTPFAALVGGALLLTAGGAPLSAEEPAEPEVVSSPVVTAATPGRSVPISVDVTGAERLALIVTEGGDGFTADWAVWVKPTLTGPAGTLKLTDLKWKSAEQGWGVTAVDRDPNGGELTVDGKPVHGIGTHARSRIVFELPEGYTTFTARGALEDGGTDQAGGTASSVQFVVYAGGEGLDEEIQDPTRSAKAELQNLTVADDLAVDLFAAEPMLLSPSNIDVDAHGRVWVCEVVNYRQFRNTDSAPREAGDRILVLEDSDGDGELDQKTVFYQHPEIDSAHGVCVLGETVIVSAGENILTFKDADGDLQADEGSRRVLFTGISGVQHDHGVHSVLFGPDGKLYFNFGNEGKQLRRPDGSPVVDLAGNVVAANRQPYQEGMAFRCDLDGSNVETLGWNFRNNWELTVDSFGRVWQSDNDDDGNAATRLNLVIPFGNYGYRDEFTGGGWRDERPGMHRDVPLRHWHLNDPGVMPNLYQSGAGSPTGIAVYEGDLLPPEYRGALLHCDAGPNAVRAYFLKPDGAGFSAEQKDLLTGENDRWFRPSDVTVAPDGSLIVADWYDPGVGGHRMDDVTRGRLFRLRPTGSEKTYMAPVLDLSTPAGALAALNSPNLDARYQGFTALAGMGEDAVEPVRAQFRDQAAPAHLRARAMWALAQLISPLRVADEAIGIEDEAIRAAGLRLLCEATDVRTEEGIKNRLARLVVGVLRTDRLDAPALWREAAVALRGVPADADVAGVTAAQLWAALAQRADLTDRWMLETLGLAAEGKWDACLDAYLATSPEADAAKQVIWRSRAKQTPALLAEALLDPARVSGEEAPRWVRAFDFQANSEQKRAALQRLAFADELPEDRATLVRLAALLRLKEAGGADEGRIKEGIERVLDEVRGTPQFVELLRTFRIQGHADALIELAGTQPTETAGVEAAGLLIERGMWKDVSTVVWGEDRTLAEGLLSAVGRTHRGDAVKFLTAVMDDENLDVARRKAAASGLAQIGQGAQLLLERAEQGELAEELRQSVAATLHASTYHNLGDRVAKVFPPPPGREKPLPPLAELTEARGDVANGKTVYMTTGTCSKCHVIKGVGREIGPDLTEIGDKLGRQALYTSILYPSAGVSHNYETHTVLTEDGSVFNGLLISETDKELKIRDQEGIERTFSKDALLEHGVQDVSLMPADIQKLMSEQELVDLVEFLTTLKK